PQSVYNRLNRYLPAPTPRALRDARGHGHLTAWDDDLLAVLRSAVERPPGDWGYRDAEWTVELLQQHLARWDDRRRSEEHTSELQSRSDLVCRLLLEKKK